MPRKPKPLTERSNKPWTVSEDMKIFNHVETHGIMKWSLVANSLPGRIPQGCRERWLNHFDHSKHQEFRKSGEKRRRPLEWREDEDRSILKSMDCNLFPRSSLLINPRPNRWAKLSKFLPNRYAHRYAHRVLQNHFQCDKIISSIHSLSFQDTYFNQEPLESKHEAEGRSISRAEAGVICCTARCRNFIVIKLIQVEIESQTFVFLHAHREQLLLPGRPFQQTKKGDMIFTDTAKAPSW
jgi:hypothetical protein